jgi:hypothetical protein
VKLVLLCRKDDIVHHLVSHGESVGGLALKYQTTTSAIQILNQLSSPHQTLTPNQVTISSARTHENLLYLQILLVIPLYSSSDMESLKSALFHLAIENNSKKYQQKELSVFGPQRSGFGYSNWGNHDIGIEDPQDLIFYQQKQGQINLNNSLSSLTNNCFVAFF